MKLSNLLDIVHACECLVGLILATEPHESEATTAVGVSIFDDDLIHSVTGLQTHLKRRILTASSTLPYLENPSRRVSSVVCHARPLRHSQHSIKLERCDTRTAPTQ